jgi:hypothetical protein
MSSPSVKGGAKKEFSEWFMESTLFGVKKLYSNKNLNYSKKLTRIIGLYNCKFALRLLDRREKAAIPINYCFNFTSAIRLLFLFKIDIYFLIPKIFVLITKEWLRSFKTSNNM